MLGTALAAVVLLQAQQPGPGPGPGFGGAMRPSAGGQEIVGYLPYYRMSSISFEKLRLCTDVIYFSGQFTADADLVFSSSRRADLVDLALLRDSMGFRLFLSIIGDFGADGFEQAVSTPAGREKMAQELALVFDQYGLDGIDIDWEFPDDWTEVGYYTDLLWRIKALIGGAGGMVTVAVAPLQLMDAAFFEPVDRVHMMAYLTDFPTFQTYVGYTLASGCPPEKLAPGLPFYGRDQVTGSAYRYSTLVGMYPVLDQDPFIDNVDDIFLNGRNTQFVKSHWVRDQGYRGMSVWELGQDITGDTSLLRAVLEGTTGTLLPESVSIVRGVLAGGGLSDLFFSDDARLDVRAGITLFAGESPLQIEVEGHSPVEAPSELRFTLESSANTPGLTQTIELFNYDTSSYEEVDLSVPGAFDGVVEVVVTTNPERFVQAGTRTMRAKVVYQRVGLTLLWPWSAKLDQAAWRIVR
ncbi:MAG: glycoside hydrolase family 18 protein [Armatimonadetes bacterium]|nr:glycoside hydrolase family 18 protein [Armatimonadota bacterium]